MGLFKFFHITSSRQFIVTTLCEIVTVAAGIVIGIFFRLPLNITGAIIVCLIVAVLYLEKCLSGEEFQSEAKLVEIIKDESGAAEIDSPLPAMLFIGAIEGYSVYNSSGNIWLAILAGIAAAALLLAGLFLLFNLLALVFTGKLPERSIVHHEPTE